MKKRAIWEYFALAGLACVAVFACLVILLFGVSMVATAIGNVAIWPLMLATALGIKLTFGEVILAGTVLLGLIVLYPDHVGKVFNHSVGAIVLAMLFGVFFIIFGFPLYAVITEVFGIEIPKWTIFPLAAITIFALFKFRK